MEQQQNNLNDAARKAKAEYMRSYRRRNPEAIKRANTNYWNKIALKAQQLQEEKPDKT